MFENQNTTTGVDAQDDEGTDGSSILPGSTKEKMNKRIETAYQHLDALYNEVLREDFFIENRSIYIINVRACEEEFKSLYADADKYSVDENLKEELGRTRRNLCAMNTYFLERITDNIVLERRETLQPQMLRWIRSLIDRYKELKK